LITEHADARRIVVMDEKLSLRYQLLSAWCGPAFLLTFIVFWGIVGTNLPAPVSPALNPHDVAVRYLGWWTQMRVGFGISLITVVLYLPWTALLTVQMARIEGRFPVLSLLQLLGGGLTVLVVSLSAVFWAVAAFRPERSPSEMQLLNDLGWLCIDLQYACTTLQMYAAAAVGLADKRPTRLFPRWVCWLTIFCGTSFFPATLTGVTTTGAFAWDGVGSYYFPYFCWLCWYGVASLYMILEVRRRMARVQTQDSTAPYSATQTAWHTKKPIDDRRTA
jgi:hypothetical protein